MCVPGSANVPHQAPIRDAFPAPRLRARAFALQPRGAAPIRLQEPADLTLIPGPVAPLRSAGEPGPPGCAELSQPLRDLAGLPEGLLRPPLRLHEAFAVTTHALRYAPDDLLFWRQRASVSGWLSRPSTEAIALQRVFDLEGDPQDAKRLLDLYVYLGQPDRAVPFAA